MSSDGLPLACVSAEAPGALNAALSALAQTLRARAVQVAGAVQQDQADPAAPRSHMDLRILPDGPVLRISQALGAGSRGCRLDPGALEQAVALAEAALARGADILIVNKFGKQEAEGRGFRGLIAEALGQGIPVLVGLNAGQVDAFEAFAGGPVDRLPADLPALLAWCSAAVPALAEG